MRSRLLLIALLASFSVFGQKEFFSNDNKNISFGMMSGCNISNKVIKGLKGVIYANQLDSPLKSRYKIGFVFGCFINKKINSKISYTSEILITQKGLIASEEYALGNEITENTRCHFDYLASSNYINYSFGNLNLFTGFELSYLLYARYKYEDGLIYDDTDWAPSIDYRKYDLSLINGVIREIDDNFSVSIRHINSFVSFYNSDTYIIDENGALVGQMRLRDLSRTWSLSLHYYL